MKIKNLSLAGLVGVSFLLGYLLNPYLQIKNLEAHRQEHIKHKDMMIKEMMAHSQYRCCLEKPCTYCIEKTPGHGQGATCDCLQDVVNGQHPCGECLGEILEGHGNKYLKSYFPQAIAEELGQEHLDTITKIINQKYN